MSNYASVKENLKIKIHMEKAREYLDTRGTIAHGINHAENVAENSRHILIKLGYGEKEAELAQVAGYLHDIGNLFNRYDHGRSGSLLSYQILKELEFDIDSIAIVLGAIGNHEETTGHSVNAVAAAVIIADKCDVHRDRVRKKDQSQFTPRDRVNYAVDNVQLLVNGEKRVITLHIEIDTEKASVMEYFEIFLTKMLMCKRAADFLDAEFRLIVNNTSLL
ncbi:hypothetical protein GGQ84_001258 [Desulfitispora alkaliphila]|uniref:HD domain-containing protein n=1 Tax=Desulfitispora alkaliphila TaxID=622674 RepID=UPI003D22F12E